MTQRERPIRAFIAIAAPETWRPALADLQCQLARALPSSLIRWTPPKQLHLTLRFLGDVLESSVPELGRALTQAVSSLTQFTLNAGPLGIFPNACRPRIVWLAATGELNTLQTLQSRVAEVTSAWGKLEKRPFHPHLTLGRVKEASSRDARRLDEILRAQPAPSLDAWPVTQIELMRSDLSPSGAKYSLLFAARLASGT